MSNEVKQSKPYVRRATLQDCRELSLTMREADRQELWHLNRCESLNALLCGLAWPQCYSVVLDEKVVAMFGVGGTFGRLGYPWMLASPDLDKIKRQFIRECRKYVAEMQRDYPVLTNVVWAKNEAHVKWISWLGFKLSEPTPMGKDGEPFIYFRKETE